MIRRGDPIQKALERLESHGVEAIDLNLACDAPHIRSLQAGSALFSNLEDLKYIVSETRKYWRGLLFVKIRLGDRTPDWQEKLKERLIMFQDFGADAIVVHPRFFEDKFKRAARHEVLPWVASITRLPLIVTGDITCREDTEKLRDKLKHASAIMLGRIVVIKPWIFAEWDKPVRADYHEVWKKMFAYILEDFEPEVAISRIKMFAKYYSANFMFGKNFYTKIYNSKTIEEIKQVSDDFFSKNPQISKKLLVCQW